jgi:hypothetical protein
LDEIAGPEFRSRAVRPFGNPMFKGQPRTPVYSNPTIAAADIDAWLALKSEEHNTMAQGSPSFLTAEVCANGHVTTSAVERHPARSAKFCPQCGAETLRACPKCEAAIRGQEAVPVCQTADNRDPGSA